MKAATKQLKRARAEVVQRFFGDYVSQLEGRIREGCQFGCTSVEGKRAFNSLYIRDKEGILLRDIGLIRER